MKKLFALAVGVLGAAGAHPASAANACQLVVNAEANGVYVQNWNPANPIQVKSTDRFAPDGSYEFTESHSGSALLTTTDPSSCAIVKVAYAADAPLRMMGEAPTTAQPLTKVNVSFADGRQQQPLPAYPGKAAGRLSVTIRDSATQKTTKTEVTIQLAINQFTDSYMKTVCCVPLGDDTCLIVQDANCPDDPQPADKTGTGPK